MSEKPVITVLPAPVELRSGEVCDTLERMLDTLLLTQSETVTLTLDLPPEASQILRDRLRDGRRARRNLDQVRDNLRDVQRIQREVETMLAQAEVTRRAALVDALRFGSLAVLCVGAVWSLQFFGAK